MQTCDAGLPTYARDAFVLLLENRPNHPAPFLADYFRAVAAPSASPLLRAHRYATLAPPSSSAFDDNLAAAYDALKPPASPTVLADDVQRLLHLLCCECPVHFAPSVLLLLRKHKWQPLSFGEFRPAVRLTVQLSRFFSGLELMMLTQRRSARTAAATVSTMPIATPQVARYLTSRIVAGGTAAAVEPVSEAPLSSRDFLLELFRAVISQSSPHLDEKTVAAAVRAAEVVPLVTSSREHARHGRPRAV